jgi:hypothetical protein
MLLVCPITWDHSFLLLLPALAIAAPRVWQCGIGRPLLSLLTLVLFAYRPGFGIRLAIPGNGEMATLLGLRPPLVHPYQTLTVLSVQFYALIALFALLVVLISFLKNSKERLSGAEI